MQELLRYTVPQDCPYLSHCAVGRNSELTYLGTTKPSQNWKALVLSLSSCAVHVSVEVQRSTSTCRPTCPSSAGLFPQGQAHLQHPARRLETLLKSCMSSSGWKPAMHRVLVGYLTHSLPAVDFHAQWTSASLTCRIFLVMRGTMGALPTGARKPRRPSPSPGPLKTRVEPGSIRSPHPPMAYKYFDPIPCLLTTHSAWLSSWVAGD